MWGSEGSIDKRIAARADAMVEEARVKAEQVALLEEVGGAWIRWSRTTWSWRGGVCLVRDS